MGALCSYEGRDSHTSGYSRSQGVAVARVGTNFRAPSDMMSKLAAVQVNH